MKTNRERAEALFYTWEYGKPLDDIIVTIEAALDEADAEIERLRAALTEILAFVTRKDVMEMRLGPKAEIRRIAAAALGSEDK